MSLENVKITSDRILIAIDHDPSEMAPGGIIVLPEKSRGKHGAYVVGIVIATGPGCPIPGKDGERFPLEVAVGDKVWLHKASLSHTVTIDGDVFILVHENEVVAILEDE